MELIQICSDNKITFKYIPDIFSLMTLNVSSETIGSMPVMELRSIPLDGWGRIVKRIIDIAVSAIVLIVASPIMLIIAILEKITSKGPIMYKHQRIGRDEKIFTFFKFHSMYSNMCDYKGGVHWSTKDDEKTRITPLGKVLRKTNLDELPQFWNILKGDMSFVGPRPELPKLVEKFEKEVPEYFRRHRVKTGLTGWAQVNGLKGDTSIKERVRYDIYYIENWSLWLDFKIIVKTVFLIIYEIFSGKYEYRSRS
jgi:exopolysaccharide biosynthesis polyprenyl glycosylphosphotransferase